MYIGPIEKPVRQEDIGPETFDRGLFAWGMQQLPARQYYLKICELALVFIALPMIALSLGGSLALPIVMSTMLTTTIILLSLTQSFHWRDLLPIDFWSEGKLLVGMTAGVAACCLLLTLLIAPEKLFSSEAETVAMLVAFPLVTALPIELVYRALFYRRYGRLFTSEPRSIIFGGFATALAYMVLFQNGSGAVIGFALGTVLGASYLRTGNFLFCVLLHWAAMACYYLIGPGIH